VLLDSITAAYSRIKKRGEDEKRTTDALYVVNARDKKYK
jgi:hypothetical protein